MSRKPTEGGVTPEPMELFRQRYLPRYTPLMARCEERLGEIADEPGGTLARSCSETLAAGGKRLRPLLVFLAANSSGDEDLMRAAVAVELVHMATLVHDDVLDNAELRRGKPTLAATYGSGVSTAAGDYLFSTAFAELAATGSAAAAAELAEVSLGLSHGELAQMQQAFDYSVTREQYFDRCRLKTSGLFIAACRLGALLAGAGEEKMAALTEFGYCLGLAFQVTDDILDYDGEAASFGKSVGTDLRDGTVTLPLILALEADASLREDLSVEMTDEAAAGLCERIRESGSLEQSARMAAGYVQRAQDAIGSIGAEQREPLALIAAMAADRNV